MTTEYGHKLNPYRKLRKQFGVKGERLAITNSLDSDSVGPGRTLTVKFPKLNADDTIVPGTARVSFKIDLTSTDANRTIVNNLGRAIISKLVVKLYSKDVFTLDNADIFYCYSDLWKTTNEREEAVEQGIQSEAIAKIRIEAGDAADNNAKNNALAAAYSNRFYIPLDFELISSHMPIHQSDIKEHLEFQLTFNDRNKIVKASGDTDAKYAISEVNLEYEVVSNSNLARTITNLHEGKTVMLFDEIVNYTTKSLNKQDDKWDIKLSVSARSLKGILLLFVDPADGGAPFDRDSEKFYNPQIEDVAIAHYIGGKINYMIAV